VNFSKKGRKVNIRSSLILNPLSLTNSQIFGLRKSKYFKSLSKIDGMRDAGKTPESPLKIDEMREA